MLLAAWTNQTANLNSPTPHHTDNSKASATLTCGQVINVATHTAKASIRAHEERCQLCLSGPQQGLYIQGNSLKAASTCLYITCLLDHVSTSCLTPHLVSSSVLFVQENSDAQPKILTVK